MSITSSCIRALNHVFRGPAAQAKSIHTKRADLLELAGSNHPRIRTLAINNLISRFGTELKIDELKGLPSKSLIQIAKFSQISVETTADILVKLTLYKKGSYREEPKYGYIPGTGHANPGLDPGPGNPYCEEYGVIGTERVLTGYELKEINLNEMEEILSTRTKAKAQAIRILYKEQKALMLMEVNLPGA